MFFIDGDDTLESMLFLADQTFLTCIKGRELEPVRDLAVGVVEPVMCLGSKLKIEQRTISAVFLKTGFWARGFLSSALDFGGELGKLLREQTVLWRSAYVVRLGGWAKLCCAYNQNDRHETKIFGLHIQQTDRKTDQPTQSSFIFYRNTFFVSTHLAILVLPETQAYPAQNQKSQIYPCLNSDNYKLSNNGNT